MLPTSDWSGFCGRGGLTPCTVHWADDRTGVQARVRRAEVSSSRARN